MEEQTIGNEQINQEITLKQVFEQDEELQQMKQDLADWKSTPDENYDEYVDGQVKRLQACIFARQSAIEAMMSGNDFVDAYNPYENSFEW